MKNIKILYITQAAMVAGLYVVLTYLAHLLGLASGAIQVRFSEALTVLPFFIPAATPGLAIGCLLSNILTGGHILDIIFGSFATYIGAVFTQMLGRAYAKGKTHYKWLAPLPPIASNVLFVPLIIYVAYEVRPLWMLFVTVGIGEIISCGILGIMLLLVVEKSGLAQRIAPSGGEDAKKSP